MGMSVIIVGAGQTTRELLRRLGEAWDVAVVDGSEQDLAALRGERPMTPVVGDGSSRLVLKQAGLDTAAALVAATSEDSINLEVCRIGKESRVVRTVAVANDPSRLPEYRAMGIPAFSPARLVARQLELQLEARRVASKALAGGRVEAVDFEVASNSPVRGRSIRELNGPTRMVAALLRNGELIIPTDHQDLTLEAQDVVTVIGSATSLPYLVHEFTRGTPRFPTQFGKRVAVALTGEADLGNAFIEAVTITRNSQATSLLVVHPEISDEGAASGLLESASYAAEGIELRHRAVSDAPGRALIRLASEESIGLIVLPAPDQDRRFGWLGAERSFADIRKLGTPVLFARGRHSYDRILVAARRTAAGRAAAHAAVDVAGNSRAGLTALAVIDPVFMTGPTAPDEARLALDELRELAALQGVDVAGVTRDGNPIAAFTDLADQVDLVVLGISKQGRALQARVANRLVARAGTSVLVVPTED